MRGRVADRAANIMKKLLFSAEGQIGRGTFWKGGIVSVFGAMLVAAALNYALAQAIPNEAGAGEGFSVNGANAVLFLVLNLLTTVSLAGRRSAPGSSATTTATSPACWVLLCSCRWPTSGTSSRPCSSAARRPEQLRSRSARP